MGDEGIAPTSCAPAFPSRQLRKTLFSQALPRKETLFYRVFRSKVCGKARFFKVPFHTPSPAGNLRVLSSCRGSPRDPRKRRRRAYPSTIPPFHRILAFSGYLDGYLFFTAPGCGQFFDFSGIFAVFPGLFCPPSPAVSRHVSTIIYLNRFRLKNQCRIITHVSINFNTISHSRRGASRAFRASQTEY